jgi:hypothetical protein
MMTSLNLNDIENGNYKEADTTEKRDLQKFDEFMDKM